jgi:hypothetical protein
MMLKTKSIRISGFLLLFQVCKILVINSTFNESI